MTITFVSNFLNHHQVPVADELYELTGHNYIFVETVPMPNSFLKSGYPDYSSKPYLVASWKSAELYQTALNACLNSDVCVFGGSGDVFTFKKERAKTGKMSFTMSERWLKRGLINLLSPRLLKEMLGYYFVFKKKPMYQLCCSAFVTKDLYKLQLYKNRCYKWGYFTNIDRLPEVEVPNQGASTSESTPLMWCARFLRWKHPELPVLLSARLKAKGYNFTLEMFGSGEEWEDTKALIAKLGVEDCVNLCGNLPNEEILQEMRKHEIFLFTSDRNEGWGAVLNEAMSAGCAVVGSDAIGSVPFLIEEGVNGHVFKSGNLDSLEEKVIELLNNRSLRYNISYGAVRTMQTIWSPKEAAKRLIELVNALNDSKETPYEMGPCSKAYPINR